MASKWENGYEALATLDADGNGRIEGSELEPLALWFDNNQDAQTQDGEVVSVIKSGVTVLFVKPDRVDAATGDIHASLGFERILNGKLVRGASVDWFAKAFNSKLEAINMWSGYNALSGSPERGQPVVRDQKTLASPMGDATGVWLWAPNRTGKNEGASFGILNLREQPEGITGYSMIEVPLEGPQSATKQLRSVMVAYPVVGRRINDGKGDVIEFIAFNDVVTTRSTARIALTASGASKLEGESTTLYSEPGQGSITYRWTGRKL
jgi:hypothetical protein